MSEIGTHDEQETVVTIPSIHGRPRFVSQIWGAISTTIEVYPAITGPIFILVHRRQNRGVVELIMCLDARSSGVDGQGEFERG